MYIVIGFIFTEFYAWFTHRYAMHGFLWHLHQDHHRKNPHRFFERNDWMIPIFAFPSATTIFTGLWTQTPAIWQFGVGSLLFGITYFVVHDLIFHARFGKLRCPAILRPFYRAHLRHHRVVQKEGTTSFGLFFVPFWKK